MCRSSAQGGRRCPGRGSSPSSVWGHDTDREDEERYLRRIEQLENAPDPVGLITGEKLADRSDAAAEAAARIAAELAGDLEQWQ